VELYNDENMLGAAFSLSEVGHKGSNFASGLQSHLGMMVAYAKNGFPLVRNGTVSNPQPGYVHNDPAFPDKVIGNSGGPLLFVRGQNVGEFLDSSIADDFMVERLAKIVVNLVPDEYAHVGPEYASYAAQTVRFSGAVAREANITVASLETLQRYIVTDTYTVGGVTKTYRGLDLLRLLNDPQIAASSLLSEVTVRNLAGGSTTLTREQLMAAAAAGKPIILAYGFATPPDNADAAPLRAADGGPMRLIVDGSTSEICVSNVSEISISASAMDRWTHSFGDYLQYADFKVVVSGQNLKHNRTYTVAQLQAMEALTVVDSYRIGTHAAQWFQGVDLYRLLATDIGFAEGLTSSSFSVTADDGFGTTFTAGDLQNGVNDKPMLLGFGRGTSPTDGLPLVPTGSSPGFNDVYGNSGGPIRLVVHDNSGLSVQRVLTIVVGAAGGNPDPRENQGHDKFDFTFYQGGQDGGFPTAGVRSVSFDGDGGMWVGTFGGGLAHLQDGADGFRVLNNTTSVPALRSLFTSGVAADSSGGIWFTQNTSYSDLSLNHGVGYMASNGTITYYNSSVPGTIPDDYVQAIEIDAAGNVWFGSLGGLTRYIPSSGQWRTWTKADGLPAESVNTIVFDSAGGVWIGCYPDRDGDEYQVTTTYSGGYAYMDAAGVITSWFYDENSEGLSPWYLGDYWVRGIAVDKDGGAWIVRSSSFINHVGGRLDYVSPDKQTVSSWTGNELLGTALTGTQEIRMVAADKNGGLWLGTSGAGLFHCTAPGKVHKVYNTATGAWLGGLPMDNVQYLRFFGDTLYVGSNGGIAWADVTLAPPVSRITIGDINGDGRIDVFDLQMLLNHIYGASMLQGDALLAADVNGDGRVDIFDVQTLLNHIYGIKLIEG